MNDNSVKQRPEPESLYRGWKAHEGANLLPV